jgi:diaminohydroxyphosphoribosylaminopyrimidine deaminase/5-amino-6-(5-phosphoribosylamino)uracil reductase
VEVRDGVLGAQARRLLAPYIKLRTRRRPWVLCKWAQTPGGLLALPAGGGRWISSRASREHAHYLRSVCDGICIGIGTLLSDDPLLTNRTGVGRRPLRIVLDSRLRTPLGSRLVRTAREFPALIATTAAALEDQSPKARELRDAGVELLALPHGPAGLDLGALLDELGRREHTYLMAEGGPAVLGAFIHGGLADELLAFVCPARLPDDPTDAALPRFDIAQAAQRLRLGSPQRQAFGPDVLWRYVLTEPESPPAP